EVLIRLAGDAVLFHDSEFRAYAEVQVEGRTKKVETEADGRTEEYEVPDVPDHVEVYPLRSAGFKHWLRWKYYQECGKAPGSQTSQEGRATWKARGNQGGHNRAVPVRTAGDSSKISLARANKEWTGAEIRAWGWTIIDPPPVKFIRPKGLLALPVPEKDGSI